MCGNDLVVGFFGWLGDVIRLVDIENRLEVMSDLQAVQHLFGMSCRGVGENHLAARQARQAFGQPLVGFDR